MNDPMRQIREPSQKECDVITELQSAVLRIIRHPFPSAPLNVCLYTAFLSDEPDKVWQFSNDGNEVKMNLWVSHDPEYTRLQTYLGLNHINFTQLIKAVKRPRSVLATHHWERCQPVWGNSSSVIESGFNRRFEFDYQPSSRALSEILCDCNRWINTQGGLKPIEFFECLNELDDPILTINNTQPFQTICYTQIPYLSVPLATIYIPKKDDDNLSDIQDNLWKATQPLQPILATYVQTAIQQFADYFKNQIHESHWHDYPYQVIPSILGLAVASVLFPVKVEVYTGVNDKHPFLTIGLPNNSFTISDPPVIPFEGELSLGDFPVQRFLLKIILMDHENPYLESLERVKELWKHPEKSVNLVSRFPLYEHHKEMFKYALKPIITGLVAFADFKITQSWASDLQSSANQISKNATRWATRLSDLAQSRVGSLIRLRELRDMAKNLNAQLTGQDLINELEAVGLNSSEDNHFAAFIDRWNRVSASSSSPLDIKHAIQADPEIAKDFCTGVSNLVETSLKRMGRYDYGVDLRISFQKWLTHSVDIMTPPIKWPIFIQPSGNIDSYNLDDLIVKPLQSALKNDNIKVQIDGEFPRLDWGCDYALLCFLCEVLFNRPGRLPDGNKVTVKYEANQWILNWESSKSEQDLPSCFFTKAQELDRSNQGGKFRSTTLKARIWFLWKIFNSINGGFIMQEKDNKYLFEMTFGIERET